MEQQEDDYDDATSRQPTTRTYTVAVSCWSRSKDITKPQRALRLLKSLLARHEQRPMVEVSSLTSQLLTLMLIRDEDLSFFFSHINIL